MAVGGTTWYDEVDTENTRAQVYFRRGTKMYADVILLGKPVTADVDEAAAYHV